MAILSHASEFIIGPIHVCYSSEGIGLDPSPHSKSNEDMFSTVSYLSDSTWTFCSFMFVDKYTRNLCNKREYFFYHQCVSHQHAARHLVSASKIPNANRQSLVEGQDNGIIRNTGIAENKLGEYFYVKAERNLATNYGKLSNESLLPPRTYVHMLPWNVTLCGKKTLQVFLN